MTMHSMTTALQKKPPRQFIQTYIQIPAQPTNTNDKHKHDKMMTMQIILLFVYFILLMNKASDFLFCSNVLHKISKQKVILFIH